MRNRQRTREMSVSRVRDINMYIWEEEVHRSGIRVVSLTEKGIRWDMTGRVQMGAIATSPPPRSARLAMNFVTSMFILLKIYTYSDNCQWSSNSSVVLSIVHFRQTCT